MSGFVTEDPDPSCCRIALKVVPGSRSDALAGPLGDRLKVKVAAPPEDGRANAAVCVLLAKTLGVNPRDITVVVGTTNPEKIVRVVGCSPDEARERLATR